MLLVAGCTTHDSPTGDDVVAAFLETVQRDDLTFHTVMDGVIEVSSTTSDEQQTVEISAEMDVSGEDAVGEVTFDIGVAITLDVLVADGEGYTENAEGEWEAVPNFEAQTQAPLNPFTRLESADLEYVGPSDDGLHLLRTDVWLGGDEDTLEAQGWEDVEFTDRSTDIHVTGEGVPVRMEFVGDATGVYEGEDAMVHFDIDYEFSDVGEPVEIPTP